MIKRVHLIISLSFIVFTHTEKISAFPKITSENPDSTVQNEPDKEYMPETFMSFFERFKWDKEFQKNRVIYPVSVSGTKIKSAGNWVFLPLYKETSAVLHVDTITYFQKDIDEQSVKLTIVDFKNLTTTNYHFIKPNSTWYLTEIKPGLVEQLSDYEFILFLKRFLWDSVFQFKHTRFPLHIFYTDLDLGEDAEIIHEKMEKGDWQYRNFLNNYLKKLVILNSKNRNLRMICVKDGGINIKYTFQKKGKNWELIKTEDYST